MAAGIPEDLEAPRRYFFLWGLFMVGEIAHSAGRRWDAVATSRWAYLGLVLVAVASTAAAGGAPVLYNTTWLTGTLAGIVVTCAAARAGDQFSDAWPLRWLGFLGRNAIVYYTSHYPVIWATVLVCAAVGIQSPWVVYATALLASLTIGTALTLTARTRAGSILFSSPELRGEKANEL